MNETTESNCKIYSFTVMVPNSLGKAITEQRNKFLQQHVKGLLVLYSYSKIKNWRHGDEKIW